MVRLRHPLPGQPGPHPQLRITQGKPGATNRRVGKRRAAARHPPCFHPLPPTEPRCLTRQIPKHPDTFLVHRIKITRDKRNLQRSCRLPLIPHSRHGNQLHARHPVLQNNDLSPANNPINQVGETRHRVVNGNTRIHRMFVSRTGCTTQENPKGRKAKRLPPSCRK